jgi:amino acid transporter
VAERTAEFVLGLAGGILGLLAAPILFLAGGLLAALGLTSGAALIGVSIAGGILSIVGLVGAAFVKSRPRASGAIMLLGGLLGLFVVLGFWLGALLLLVAGVVALLRREKHPPPPPSSPTQTVYCTTCGKSLMYVQQYQKWYCDKCKQYRE